MPIEIKENRFLFISDPNRKEASYHICDKKPSFFELLRYQYKEIHLSHISFAWRVMTDFGNFLLPDISNCPYCGIDLEKDYQDYQAKINPLRKKENKKEENTPQYFEWGC